MDVCIGGRELRSGLPYGGTILKDSVATGAKVLKVYRPDPRRCGGSLIATYPFSLAAAQDQTMVITKTAPRIVVFQNL